MDYWLELQIELQIKHTDILKNSTQELLSNLMGQQQIGSDDDVVEQNAQALKNMLTVVQWERKPQQLVRCM